MPLLSSPLNHRQQSRPALFAYSEPHIKRIKLLLEAL